MAARLDDILSYSYLQIKPAQDFSGGTAIDEQELAARLQQRIILWKRGH